MKIKTQIYFIIVSLIISLLCVAIVKQDNSSAGNKNSTANPVQQLKSLEKAAPQSPEMKRFIQHEESAQQANQDAANSLPK